MSDFRGFEELSDTGILWLINRVVFHPRGFAMSIHIDAEGKYDGWNIEGDGSEIWRFSLDSDDKKFIAVEEFLNSLRDQENIIDNRKKHNDNRKKKKRTTGLRGDTT
jgi:hypothetical protein